MTEKTYFIYDDRYRYSPNSAVVLSVSDSLEEAREDREMFGGCVIVEYSDNNGELENPKIVE